MHLGATSLRDGSMHVNGSMPMIYVATITKRTSFFIVFYKNVLFTQNILPKISIKTVSSGWEEL